MATTYKLATDVRDRAEKLIEKHHKHLIDVHIEYVFRDPPARRGEKLILGKARKITGLNAFISDHGRPHLLIEIAEEEWKSMNAAQEKALLDHELSHCGWDEEKDAPTIIPHDVEEFAAVIARHGLWRNDLKVLGQAVQMHLDIEVEV